MFEVALPFSLSLSLLSHQFSVPGCPFVDLSPFCRYFLYTISCLSILFLLQPLCRKSSSFLCLSVSHLSVFCLSLSSSMLVPESFSVCLVYVWPCVGFFLVFLSVPVCFNSVCVCACVCVYVCVCLCVFVCLCHIFLFVFICLLCTCDLTTETYAAFGHIIGSQPVFRG